MADDAVRPTVEGARWKDALLGTDAARLAYRGPREANVPFVNIFHLAVSRIESAADPLAEIREILLELDASCNGLRRALHAHLDAILERPPMGTR